MKAVISFSLSFPKFKSEINHLEYRMNPRNLFASLLVSLFFNSTAFAAECIDTDGDGWGWDGTSSCEMPCVDNDGDGWGWNGTSSCLIDSNNSQPILKGIELEGNFTLDSSPRFTFLEHEESRGIDTSNVRPIVYNGELLFQVPFYAVIKDQESVIPYSYYNNNYRFSNHRVAFFTKDGAMRNVAMPQQLQNPIEEEYDKIFSFDLAQGRIVDTPHVISKGGPIIVGVDTAGSFILRERFVYGTKFSDNNYNSFAHYQTQVANGPDSSIPLDNTFGCRIVRGPNLSPYGCLGRNLKTGAATFKDEVLDARKLSDPKARYADISSSGCVGKNKIFSTIFNWDAAKYDDDNAKVAFAFFNKDLSGPVDVAFTMDGWKSVSLSCDIDPNGAIVANVFARNGAREPQFKILLEKPNGFGQRLLDQPGESFMRNFNWLVGVSDEGKGVITTTGQLFSVFKDDRYFTTHVDPINEEVCYTFKKSESETTLVIACEKQEQIFARVGKLDIYPKLVIDKTISVDASFTPKVDVPSLQAVNATKNNTLVSSETVEANRN